MADSAVFEWACETLERVSGLSRLQARGTLRLVLTQAGLDSRSLRASQLRVVAVRLLPKELRVRGLSDPDAIGAEVAACPAGVDQQAAGSAPLDPEDVFKSLGRRD
jgi:hypothetical protein